MKNHHSEKLHSVAHGCAPFTELLRNFLFFPFFPLFSPFFPFFFPFFPSFSVIFFHFLSFVESFVTFCFDIFWWWWCSVDKSSIKLEKTKKLPLICVFQHELLVIFVPCFMPQVMLHHKNIEDIPFILFQTQTQKF